MSTAIKEDSFTNAVRRAFHQENSQEYYAFGSNYNPIAETAFECFLALGIPTIKSEEWKYTSLKAVSSQAFERATTDSVQDTILTDLPSLKALDAYVLVFINGHFVPERSIIPNQGDAFTVTDMVTASKSQPKQFEQHFAKYADYTAEALVALNTSMPSNGAFVRVGKGNTVDKPILIYHYADGSAADVLVQPRNLIVAEENAQMTVVEFHLSTETGKVFSNVVNEVYAGKQSRVEFYSVQNQKGNCLHTAYTQIFQEANSSVHQVNVTLDGKLVRNNLHFFMNGSNCDTLLFGLYLAAKKNHIDNHTRVDHAFPNCYSNQLYKGIMQDESVAVFNGKIKVHVDAQKTNAYQRNQNILLSNAATVQTKPQLEIFADDVKCTHGATIGQLDSESLFYLRSRGIPEAEAKRMLLNAYADDIAEKIMIPQLVELIETEIAHQLLISAALTQLA